MCEPAQRWKTTGCPPDMKTGRTEEKLEIRIGEKRNESRQKKDGIHFM